MLPYSEIAGGVGWLESRDDNTGFSNSFQTTNNRTAAQQKLIDDLRFSGAKSMRISTIILASLNILAGFSTVMGIICVAYFRKRRSDRNFRFWRNGFNFVPQADIYPLVVSLAIFMQSFIFAGVQSTGLDTLLGFGCTWIAQLMLPAVFIAPYTQLVFAVEITIRALRNQPFGPRRKFNIPICFSLIGMLVLANFLVADFVRSPDLCLSSLFWFVLHYSVLCFGLLVAINSILLICLVVIFFRLFRSIKIEETARVAASGMVYYLGLAIISNSCIIPFFFVQSFGRGGLNSNTLTLGMVASVVANVSGLMTCGIYLFLKSSILTTIGPRKVGKQGNKGAQLNSGPDDPDDSGFNNQLMNPVTGPPRLRRVDSEASLISNEDHEKALHNDKNLEAAPAKNSSWSRESLRSNRIVSAVASVLMPKAPERAGLPSPSPAAFHPRKRYSLFPRNTVASKAPATLLPATTYSLNDPLKPPLSMANLANIRHHRRDSSQVSSATVQIGIRLSSVAGISPLCQSKLITPDNKVYTVDCPNLDTQSPKYPTAIPYPPPSTPNQSNLQLKT